MGSATLTFKLNVAAGCYGHITDRIAVIYKYRYNIYQRILGEIIYVAAVDAVYEAPFFLTLYQFQTAAPFVLVYPHGRGT